MSIKKRRGGYLATAQAKVLVKEKIKQSNIDALKNRLTQELLL